MKLFFTLVLLCCLSGASFGQTDPVRTLGDKAATKAANDLCLAAYAKSGGNAYYCNLNGTRNPNGRSVFVSYTHNDGKRVPTESLFKLKNIQKLLLYPDRVGALRLDGDILFDVDLAGIDRMEGLQELLISGEFSNASLEHLAKLTKLKKLWIADTRITGSGLSRLKTLSSLKMLHVDSVGLTADDFIELKALKNLRSLDVDNAESVEAEIGRVLPDTSVNHGPLNNK